MIADKDWVCKARTLTFVLAKLDRPQKGLLLIEAKEENLAETVGSVYHWKNDDNRIAVINTMQDNIVIKKNSEWKVQRGQTKQESYG